MSQYANFFIRYDDTFIPISDFSTSSYIKSLVKGFAPWEKVRAMSVKDINDFRESARNDVIRFKKEKAMREDLIKEVAQFNNSAEDKLEVIENIRFDIKDYDEMIEEAVIGEYFFVFLGWLIDAVRYNEPLVKDIDKYIYVGIEIGSPTLEDIKDE